MDKELKEKLTLEKKNGLVSLTESERKEMNEYCEGYKQFLNTARTEREANIEAIRLAKEKGFKEFKRGMELKAGDKVYFDNRGKMVIFSVIGKLDLSAGVQIGAAHIDSPRLDLKTTPLYEDSELAYFKTHYYGGIRKYQWVTIPLELHGVVIKKDGEVVNVKLGEGDEPKLVVTDLLPHLGQTQNEKPLAKGIEAEQLNLLVGSEPIDGEESEAVKLNILKLIYEKYGFTEEDFSSAELEAVPATKATDIGIDRSMIGSYGHDDRVCAYAQLKAILDIEGVPEKTAVCVLADKEEIGSDGVTGMLTHAFDTFMEDLCEIQDVKVRECLENSFCLSCDVTAAYDPNFPEVFEKRNEAFLNRGIGICKYTGARGKSGASDASAEVVAYVRQLFEREEVKWQISEMGKVDQGGGGTVALTMADRNINTIDAGVPVLAMHSPFEVVAKFDCYMTYRGMKAVFKG